MGYASYLVYKAGGGAVPLTLYAVQLALNLAWSPLFFKVKEIGYAVADITGMICSASGIVCSILATSCIADCRVSPLSMPVATRCSHACTSTPDKFCIL